MCTITFVARRRGYYLGMNRDEQRTRPIALAPQVRRGKGSMALFPAEPGGGTWISVNHRGVVFALINWYAVRARPIRGASSRGSLVPGLSGMGLVEEVEEELRSRPLGRIKPFRLIGFFPKTTEIVEWRWDLQNLTCHRHPWQCQQWISSGLDEPAAQRVRGQIFLAAQKQKSAGTLDWLRRLHRSHRPVMGPCSHCMHRSDAQTVSYTEVVVSPGQAIMRYQAGSPCQDGAVTEHGLPRPAE